MTVFISTKDRGLARAVERVGGAWAVEHHLEDRKFHILEKDPAQPGLLYAGVEDRGVWRSTDAGSTWMPAGLEGKVIKSVTVSPHDSQVVYAGSMPAYLYRSVDGGSSWQEMTGFRQVPGRWWWRSPADPTFQACIQEIAVSPTDPDVLMAGIEFGAVVRSADSGQTWTGHRRGALRDCHSLAFHHRDGNWVYEGGGSGGGAAFSRDSGRTWTQPKRGLDRHYGWACAADPARPEVWYASLSKMFSWAQPGVPAAHIDGHANAGIYRSMDGGPWELLAGGLPEPLDYMAYALLTDPAAPGALWAGLSNGQVWCSLDYGDTWSQLPFSLGQIQRSLVMV